MTASRDIAARLTEAVTEHWGSRCPEFDADCPTCQAWAEFDKLAALEDQNRALEAATIEKCAKVAEAWRSPLRPGTETRRFGHEEASRAIAASLRALASIPGEA